MRAMTGGGGVPRLQFYHFHVVYKPGKENIADTMSRFPHKGKAEDFDDTEKICPKDNEGSRNWGSITKW